MVRSCSTAFAVFVCLLVGSQAVDGPRPVTPPRPGPQIAPDVLPPGPAPLDEPMPDDLEGEFRITAIVAGEVIPDEENVELDPGELLTLKIAGQPAADGEELSAINWGLNRESKNLSIYPADGHHITFTAPSSGAWLFYAAANNPDPLGAPLLAARWVIVGTPTPEPTPTKPDEPGPAEPAETNASLASLIKILRPQPAIAAELRDFYARLAKEIKADTAHGLTTLGELRAWQVAEERKQFANTPATKIVGVAAAIGGFLDEELGLDDVALNHERAAAAFLRLSEACGRAAK